MYVQGHKFMSLCYTSFELKRGKETLEKWAKILVEVTFNSFPFVVSKKTNIPSYEQEREIANERAVKE